MNSCATQVGMWVMNPTSRRLYPFLKYLQAKYKVKFLISLWCEQMAVIVHSKGCRTIWIVSNSFNL